MLTGDNEIINRAGQARDLTGEKQILERVQLAYLAALTEGKGEATEPNLISELNKEFGAGNYTLKKVSGTPIGVTISEKDYYFDGTVTSGSGDEDTPKFELTIAGDGESTTTPPNPDSTVFEHVEGTTVANGYVIRDKYNGNEFVWVPVEKNQKITLDVEKEEDITRIKLIDPTGKELDLELPATIGKKYKKNNTTTKI